ncbi:MAG: protein kinase [Acidobacteriota bacterium]
MAATKNLGRYEIVRELGKGAMGVVYEAVDPAIGRKVALKTILPQQGISTEEQEMRKERFQREARAAGVLSHPNIVTVYDVGEDRFSDTTFFAMEFITGDDLSKVLRARGPLPPEEVISVLAQVGDALDYAHRNGIVHRDIKPANIVLMPNGRVKVTDFGIAKLDSSTLTQTGAYLGTPTFMAPEMISGRQVDGRADLFSLGVVAYQLLTNAKPFAGENLATLSYQIVNRDPTPVRQHRPDLPAEVEDVMLHVLAKQPEDRYANCMEFVRDMKAVLVPDADNTVDYAEQTRAVGGPPSARSRTVARPSEADVTRSDRSMASTASATRVEQSQATLASVGKTGGLLIGVAGGLALLFFATVAIVVYLVFLRKPVVPIPTPTPPPTIVTPTQTVAPPSPTIPSPPPTTAAPPSPTLPTPDPAELAKKQRLEGLYNDATQAYVAGDYNKTIDICNAILKEDGGNQRAFDLLDRARKSKRDEELAKRTPTPMPMPSPSASPTPSPSPTMAGMGEHPTAKPTEVAKGPDSTPAPAGHAGHGGEPAATHGAPPPGDGGVESAGEGSTLAINFEHRLESGTITVWVDGKLVMDEGFEGKGKALIKIKRFQIGEESKLSKSISVSPGEHEVRVRVNGSGVDTMDRVSTSFKAGKTRQLNVGIGNVDRKIELEWE